MSFRQRLRTLSGSIRRSRRQVEGDTAIELRPAAHSPIIKSFVATTQGLISIYKNCLRKALFLDDFFQRFLLTDVSDIHGFSQISREVAGNVIFLGG